MIRKVLLLINPLIEQRPRRRRDLLCVQQAFRSAGVRVHTKETLPDHGAGDLVRSLGPQFDAIIVCGGDGTIFDAVQGAVGTAMPIGIVPFGTGNILAQNFHIPLAPAEAVAALLRARRRRVPLGRITCAFPHQSQRSWYFVFTAGLGMHASLLGASTAWGKHSIGQAAYYAAGIDLLLRGRIVPFEMATTDAQGCVETRQCCEAIGVRVGALNRWRPGGDLDRNSIRIVAVEGTSRAALARASYHAIVHRTTSASSRASWGVSSGDVAAGDVAASARNGAALSGDFVRAVFRPVPGYPSAVEVQADGEVLGTSSATIEITSECVTMLSPEW